MSASPVDAILGNPERVRELIEQASDRDFDALAECIVADHQRGTGGHLQMRMHVMAIDVVEREERCREGAT